MEENEFRKIHKMVMKDAKKKLIKGMLVSLYMFVVSVYSFLVYFLKKFPSQLTYLIIGIVIMFVAIISVIGYIHEYKEDKEFYKDLIENENENAKEINKRVKEKRNETNNCIS